MWKWEPEDNWWTKQVPHGIAQCYRQYALRPKKFCYQQISLYTIGLYLLPTRTSNVYSLSDYVWYLQRDHCHPKTHLCSRPSIYRPVLLYPSAHSPSSWCTTRDMWWGCLWWGNPGPRVRVERAVEKKTRFRSWKHAPCHVQQNALGSILVGTAVSQWLLRDFRYSAASRVQLPFWSGPKHCFQDNGGRGIDVTNMSILGHKVQKHQIIIKPTLYIIPISPYAYLFMFSSSHQ